MVPMKIKQRDIARKHGLSDAMISKLLSKDRTTDRWELARDLSKFSNKPAITFIHDKYKELFKKAYPKVFR